MPDKLGVVEDVKEVLVHILIQFEPATHFDEIVGAKVSEAAAFGFIGIHHHHRFDAGAGTEKAKRHRIVGNHETPSGNARRKIKPDDGYFGAVERL